MTEAMEEKRAAPLVERKESPRGFINFRMEDSILERMRLDGKAGVFRSNLTDEEFTSLTVVPLEMTRSRTMFGDGENGEREVVCRSGDGTGPDWSKVGFWGGVETPRACMACPHSQWQENKVPPECSEYWNLLVVTPGTTVPFVLSAKGTSIAAIRQMMTLLSKTGRDLCSFAVTFTAEQAGSGTRTYYRMVFAGHEELSEADAEIYANLYDHLVVGNTGIAHVLSGVQQVASATEDAPPF